MNDLTLQFYSAYTFYVTPGICSYARDWVEEAANEGGRQVSTVVSEPMP